MPLAGVLSAGGRLALAGAFTAAPRAFVSVRARGLEHDPRQPATIYAITHKRDLDAIAPLPILLAHRGPRGLTRDVRFAMRGDFVQPGFLSRIVRRPDWFARALRPLALNAILRGIGILPLDALYVRPFEAWIREALRAEGDVLIGSILAAEAIRQVAEAASEASEALAARPLSSLLAWRYFPLLQDAIGPEIFAGPARRRAEQRAVEAAKRQLEECAAWLRSGGSLYTSPEGYLSPDGRISPIRAGLHRILREGPDDALIVPVAIIYDFLTTGRPRMWIDVAPPLLGAARLGPHELEAALRTAWLGALRFTCTQLASAVLMERFAAGERSLTARALAHVVLRRARELADAGRNVDPDLLLPRRARRQAERYLRACERLGVTERVSRGRWALAREPAPLRGAPDEPGYRTSPIRYALNELRDMLAPRAATLDRGAAGIGPWPRHIASE